MIEEPGNIFLAVPEGRNNNGYDIQTIIKVLPEPVFPDRLLNVAVRRGNDPDVRLNRLVSADPFELVLLQHPQQFYLHRGGQFADFIQEQRSLVGCFEPADASGRRSGKGPFSCPNSSLSSNGSGNAAQFTLISGKLARGLL